MRLLRLAVAATIACAALVLRPEAARAHGTDAEVRRLPPLSVAGAPRSLVTFSVALPAELEDAQNVQYSVELLGTTEVLGRLDGALGGAGRRQILLTLRVPSDARVGLLDVADVHFRTEDGRVIIVPIILRVPAVRVIRLIAPPMFQQLRQGDRLEVTYRVQNLGNAAERVRMVVEPPSGWVLRSSRSATVTVEPFETQDVTFRVAIPAIADGGEYLVGTTALRAADGDSVVLATASARLQVEPREVTAPGLEFRPFVAAAATRNARGMATGFSMSGAIADSTSLFLTVMPISTQNGSAGLGLAGIGAAGVPVQASITGRGWTTNIGSTSASISDLTGLYVVGVGAQAAYDRNGKEARALVAKPFGGDNRSGGHLAAGYWTRTAMGRVGGSVSNLRESEDGRTMRDLTAIGADWQSPEWKSWVLDAGVALRSTFGESGLGFRSQALRETARDFLRLRYAHAPGGGRAFANGTNTFDAEASRDFTDRLSLQGNVFATQDESPAIGESKNYTASLSQQYRLNDVAVVRAQLMTWSFHTQPPGALVGAFGSSQTMLGLGAGYPLARWTMTTDVRAGVLGRESELFSGSVSRQRVAQQEVEVTATRGVLGSAQLALGSTFTSTGAGLGVPQQAHNGFVSLGGLRLPVGAERSIAFFTRVGYSSSELQRSMVSSLLSATTQLPGGIDLIASLERNPFFRDREGRPQWIAALRLSTSTTVFVPQRLQRVAGVVFEDLNGNGKRDAGERGVPGVVLRQAGVKLVTEADGVYRAPANVRGRLQVDPLGLPDGFVASPRVGRDLAEVRDIPLVQTGTLNVRLALAADADGRVPQVVLSRASVWLVDAEGMEWVGRVDEDNLVHFENVPTGRYGFRFDFSRLSEALRAEEGVLVEVAAGAEREVTVTLRGRNVRMITPPNRNEGGRGSGRGGAGGRGGQGGAGL